MKELRRIPITLDNLVGIVRLPCFERLSKSDGGEIAIRFSPNPRLVNDLTQIKHSLALCLDLFGKEISDKDKAVLYRLLVLCQQHRGKIPGIPCSMGDTLIEYENHSFYFEPQRHEQTH